MKFQKVLSSSLPALSTKLPSPVQHFQLQFPLSPFPHAFPVTIMFCKYFVAASLKKISSSFLFCLFLDYYPLIFHSGLFIFKLTGTIRRVDGCIGKKTSPPFMCMVPFSKQVLFERKIPLSHLFT